MRSVVAAISLLLLIAFAIVVSTWVRSYFVIDEWSMANEDGQVIAVVSYQGAIHHTRAGNSAATRRWSYDAHDVPEGATWAHFYTTPGNVTWRRFGFARIQRGAPLVAGQGMPFGTPPGGMAAANKPAAWGTAGMPARYSVAPWLMVPPYDAWIIPYWPLAVATGALPLLWFPRFLRRAYRRRKGLCASCGYDLRASGDRCPECGAAIAPSNRRGRRPITAS